MNDSMVGTHVQRGSHVRRGTATGSAPFVDGRTAARASRNQVDAMMPATTSGEGAAAYRQRIQQRRYAEEIQRRARRRRIVTAIIAIVVVLGIAAGAGYLAFRGTIGSELALKDSDAASQLVAVKSTDPYYVVITAELGAVAKPLEKAGPDVIILARVDREAKSLALVNIPSGLQISVDNTTRRLGDIALDGDAALISAISTFAKIDITHLVKIGEGGLAGIVDALGGIELEVDQVIDDPQAGDEYIPAGQTTLDSESALTYLRATNLTLGTQDQLAHQTYFAAQLLKKLFSSEGSVAGRMDSMGPFLQTDMSLGDIEAVANWVKDLSLGDIVRVVLPGYETAVTGVVDTGDSLYVTTSSEMASIIEALEKGEVPDVSDTTHIEPAEPSSFTIEVQNGTEIAGAASVTSDTLSGLGFRVEKSGNAEQQVYGETLVIYKDDATGPAQANAVIEALGIGRAVDGQTYYSFDTDILLIIGSDYKPVA